MIKRLIDNRLLLLGMLIGATCIAGLGLKTAVVPDNSIRVWFLDDDPKLVDYHQFHERFGNDEVILLHVHEPGGIVQPAVLRRLDGLVKELEAQAGVARIDSLLNAKDMVLTKTGRAFARIIRSPMIDDPKHLQHIGDMALESPLIRDRLLSADGKQAMLWIQMAVTDDFDNQRDLFVGQVRASAAKHLGEMSYALAGMGVIYTGLNQALEHDFGLFMSMTYLVMFITLWLIFRNLKLVVATGGVIAVGTIVCLGTYGLMGHRLNMVTVLLPTLVIVLGIADAVHFPAALLGELKETTDRRQALTTGLSKILVPCLMTTLTTMVGFLALTTSPMAAIRELGIFAAVGVGSALLACTVLMSVAFLYLKDGLELPKYRGIEPFMGWCARALRQRPQLLVVVVFAFVGFSAYGTSQLQADTYTLGYLPNDHQVVDDHQTIESQWGHYFPVELIVRPRRSDLIPTAAVLNATEQFEREVSKRATVSNSLSLARIYRRVLSTQSKTQLVQTPFDDQQIKSLHAQLTHSVGPLEWSPDKSGYEDNIFARLMTPDGSMLRITLIAGMASSSKIARELDSILELAQDVYGDLATVEAAGYVPLYVQIVDYILQSQRQAFVIALALIFVLMVIWLRSIRLALISVVANALPVGMMLAVMYGLGQNLDIASATIAAIVLGVAIDDTIHFLYHWRRCEEAQMNWDESLDYTYEHAGVPAVITTVLLMVGFPVLMLASVKSVFYFGLLTTIAAFAALFCDLFVLPLLLKAWPAKPSTT